jgi:hypothetical protein
LRLDKAGKEIWEREYYTVEKVIIHHTDSPNEQDPVTAIRAIYYYHAVTQDWGDIGYNFLVDRFGRIWEGRWGGVNKAVVGAHTLGYNEVGFAMSAIGNFEEVQPRQAVLDAYAELFAWKLSKYDIRADASKLWVKDRYLQAINGHRDVGQTACPGRYLYAQIPKIRQMAAKIQRGTTSTPKPTPKPTPTPKAKPKPKPKPARDGASSGRGAGVRGTRPIVMALASATERGCPVMFTRGRPRLKAVNSRIVCR